MRDYQKRAVEEMHKNNSKLSWPDGLGKMTALVAMYRKCRKERIRKDEFDAGNRLHFRLQTRGGAWRYYRRIV